MQNKSEDFVKGPPSKRKLTATMYHKIKLNDEGLMSQIQPNDQLNTLSVKQAQLVEEHMEYRPDISVRLSREAPNGIPENA